MGSLGEHKALEKASQQPWCFVWLLFKRNRSYGQESTKSGYYLSVQLLYKSLTDQKKRKGGTGRQFQRWHDELKLTAGLRWCRVALDRTLFRAGGGLCQNNSILLIRGLDIKFKKIVKVTTLSIEVTKAKRGSEVSRKNLGQTRLGIGKSGKSWRRPLPKGHRVISGIK
ncbi:hypothetical protein evm_001654 [Chilo suppressalis]|nr:hypothetical protein evm_001654 [Chilo suppressalis]